MRKLSVRLLALSLFAPALVAAGQTGAHAEDPPIAAITAEALVLSPGNLLSKFGAVKIMGTGCHANSPVSAVVWGTAGGITYTKSGTADSSGAFSIIVELGGNVAASTEVGANASCTETHNYLFASNYKYFPLAPSDAAPEVFITSLGAVDHGTAAQFMVERSAYAGTTTLTLDGSPLTSIAETGNPRHVVSTPAGLAIGNHTLGAVFTPAAVTGKPPVSTELVFTVGTPPQIVEPAVVKKATTTSLAISKKKVKKNKKVRFTVKVSEPSGQVPTGKVQIRRGTKVIKTISLSAGNKGKKSVSVKIKLAKGTKKLHAVYLGTTNLDSSKSPTKKLKVT